MYLSEIVSHERSCGLFDPHLWVMRTFQREMKAFMVKTVSEDNDLFGE